jgi:hypothetical protein
MLNEHVVATTLVALCSQNVNPFSIYPEVEADLNHHNFHYAWPWPELTELEEVFEVKPGHLGGDGIFEPAVQQLGRISTSAGRLLVLPSVLRPGTNASLSLADPSKPGQFQMLAIYLVDPNYRICSTRNVPPQDHEWWASVARLDKVLDRERGGRPTIPNEVAAQIRTEIGGWPFSEDDIQAAMKARKDDEYVFCRAVEHGVHIYDFNSE